MSPFDTVTEGLLKLYYPRRARNGEVPKGGAWIVVANHPNGLLDPMLVRVLLGVRTAFLAKSTFWNNPLGRWTMESAGALPVYRPHEADASQNEATFARCRTLLAGGTWLALFPEGKSHDEPMMQPLKTGAARIALTTLAEHPGLPLQILPVGLYYEAKATFRTAATATVGVPVAVADLLPLFLTEPKAAVEALTDRVEAALGAVVLQGESEQLVEAFAAVARWVEATPSTGSELPGEQTARIEARARGYAARWQASTAAERERAAMAYQRFGSRMRGLGVKQPWAVLEPRPPQVWLRVLGLALILPIAALGALLGWLPYRLVRPVAERMADGHDDVLGTMKVLLGALVMTLHYGGLSVIAAAIGGIWAGLGMLLLGPLTGFVALRFSERAAARAEALRGLWFARDADLRGAVARERAALVAAVG